MFRLPEKRHCGADARRLAAQARRRSGGHVTAEFDRLQQNVARQIEIDRTRLAVARHGEGLVQSIRNEIGPVDALGPFGDRAKDQFGIDLLAGAAKRRRRGAAPGKDHHRQRADKGFGHVGHEIGRAWPGRDQADRRFAGELRVRGRHAGCGLFMADQEMTDLRRVVEAVIDRQHVPAGNAVDRLHALGLQHLNDGAAGRHLLQQCRGCGSELRLWHGRGRTPLGTERRALRRVAACRRSAAGNPVLRHEPLSRWTPATKSRLADYPAILTLTDRRRKSV